MDSEKKCTKCGKIKSLTEFYKHNGFSSGIHSTCRECCKSYAKMNHRRTFEARRVYEKKRDQTPERIASRARRSKKHVLRHPLRQKARWMARSAIKYSRLVQQPCEICGEKKVQAHHDDYEKPLEVRWLCFTHHRMTHGQYKYLATGPKEVT